MIVLDNSRQHRRSIRAVRMLVAVLLCTLPLTGGAQGTAVDTGQARPAAQKMNEFLEGARQGVSTGRLPEADSTQTSGPKTPDEQVMLPDPPPSGGIDTLTRQAYLTALRAYYDYRTSAYAHRHSVFAWQLISSRIIFASVILLVMAGVYFSGVQFHADMRTLPGNKPGRESRRSIAVTEHVEPASEPISDAPPKQSDEPLESATKVHQITSIEASTSGLKVSSPVLGVIILSISLLFFYLYLAFVYPIHEIL